MNNKILISILFSMPLLLLAQAEENMVPAEAEASAAESAVESSEPMVVEIPEAPIDGATMDVDASEIPTVSASLPSSTEVVLDIAGDTVNGGSATMNDEETISVDFPDEDVRTILRNVADLFDLNLVIPDALQGRTSLKLRNITWRQVFEVVLEPLGFTYVEDRNIIRIKSVDALSTEPVDTRVFVINYSRADQLRASLAPLVDQAAGGLIQVDARSNSLVITERPSRMNKIQEIIDRLDRATEQVMIESKFVEVNIGDSNALGVDWAFLDNPTDGEGIVRGDRAVGGNFNSAAVGGNLAPFIDNNGTLQPGFLNENAADGLLAVFSQRQYAATLRALERDTKSRLISNPTVVVMNNNEATFQVGEDYPIREYSINRETGQLESGALEYRQIGIVLTVKPSVNAQGMINLEISPKIDSIDETNFVAGPNGLVDQVFDVRRVNTQVTIKDGFTIALGGLSSQEEGETVSKIPLLGSLPMVGKLFSNTTVTDNKTNLIIFLTAKTLNPDGTTYRDIIDPRVLDEVNHIEADSPGYEVSEEEAALLKQAEVAREEEAAAERKLRSEIRIEDPDNPVRERWHRQVDIFNEKKTTK